MEVADREEQRIDRGKSRRGRNEQRAEQSRGQNSVLLKHSRVGTGTFKLLVQAKERRRRGENGWVCVVQIHSVQMSRGAGREVRSPSSDGSGKGSSRFPPQYRTHSTITRRRMWRGAEAEREADPGGVFVEEIQEIPESREPSRGVHPPTRETSSKRNSSSPPMLVARGGTRKAREEGGEGESGALTPEQPQEGRKGAGSWERLAGHSTATGDCHLEGGGANSSHIIAHRASGRMRCITRNEESPPINSGGLQRTVKTHRNTSVGKDHLIAQGGTNDVKNIKYIEKELIMEEDEGWKDERSPRKGGELRQTRHPEEGTKRAGEEKTPPQQPDTGFKGTLGGQLTNKKEETGEGRPEAEGAHPTWRRRERAKRKEVSASSNRRGSHGGDIISIIKNKLEVTKINKCKEAPREETKAKRMKRPFNLEVEVRRWGGKIKHRVTKGVIRVKPPPRESSPYKESSDETKQVCIATTTSTDQPDDKREMSSPAGKDIFTKANEGGSLLARAGPAHKRSDGERSKTPPSAGRMTPTQAHEQAAVREEEEESARKDRARETRRDRDEKRRVRAARPSRRPATEPAQEGSENSIIGCHGESPKCCAPHSQRKREAHNRRAALEEQERQAKRSELAAKFRAGPPGEAQFGGVQMRGEARVMRTQEEEEGGDTLTPPPFAGALPPPAMGGGEGGGWRPPAAFTAEAQLGGTRGGTNQQPPQHMTHSVEAEGGGDPVQSGLARAMGACFTATDERRPPQQMPGAGKPAPNQKGGGGKGPPGGKGGRGKGGGYAPHPIPAELRQPTWAGLINTGDARGVIPSQWAHGFQAAGGGQREYYPPPSSGAVEEAEEATTPPLRRGREEEAKEETHPEEGARAREEREEERASRERRLKPSTTTSTKRFTSWSRRRRGTTTRNPGS